VLGGVALEGEAKERYNAIQQQLAQLSTKFSNNVLDATKVGGWALHISSRHQLVRWVLGRRWLDATKVGVAYAQAYGVSALACLQQRWAC
jgi:hypothetical protein